VAEARRNWYLLVHQLPPKPAYLRAKIAKRLAGVGGVALKNSVYVLPERDDCLEDLLWIAQEAAAGGGEAYVLKSEFLAGIADAPLEGRFRRQVTESYETLKQDVARALESTRQRAAPAAARQEAGSLPRLRKRLEKLANVDFFDAPARKEVEAMLHALEARVRPGSRDAAGALVARSRLVGRRWATRCDPKVDRLASAWLIRRFVDPGARFRFVDVRREGLRAGEIGFDMSGGEFSHEGDRCTFEVLLARLGIREPALKEIAEIVHDIDLKDEKFGRPETPGIRQMIGGLTHAHADDQERLAAGLVVFDHLYASFAGRPGPREATRSRARGRARRTK